MAAFAYAGTAQLSVIQEDGYEPSTLVEVMLRETLPGVFELHIPPNLPAAQAAVWVRVTLPDERSFSGAVRYLSADTLTFRLDRTEPA
ncbi:hypothetical protein HDC30_005757 [Pseudomonas sp. JAI115]|uniref:hypothetical protein n=1 Tax=Pseudomonas sp. JAI115 TaxID=2723061 RepID=UPI0016195D01|nr:hypothetical protein [Pseudomonas sp. JAI115]MBB6158499.1 hypothetical protein [Pseudomonas sp. JAI115]